MTFQAWPDRLLYSMPDQHGCTLCPGLSQETQTEICCQILHSFASVGYVTVTYRREEI